MGLIGRREAMGRYGNDGIYESASVILGTYATGSVRTSHSIPIGLISPIRLICPMLPIFPVPAIRFSDADR
jgi:hypothetical protein